MSATDHIRRQASTASSRVLVIAQLMALAALLLDLAFLFRTTGGSVFLFTTLAPLLVFGSGCLLLFVMITAFRSRHKTVREMLAQVEVLMHLTSPVNTGRSLSERLDTLALLARASLGAKAVAVVLLRGNTTLIASGEALIVGEPVSQFALRVKDTEGLAVYDSQQVAALLSLERPPASSVAVSSLRRNGEVGIMLAEFRPEALTHRDSDLLLDLLRIFAENASIAIDNAAVLDAPEPSANSGPTSRLFS